MCSCARRGLPELCPDPLKERPAIQPAVGRVWLPAAPHRLWHRSLLRQVALWAETQQWLCPARSCGAAWGGPGAAADGAAWLWQHCCVCGQSGATIMCCEENCNSWFHLPCAKEGGCVTQYIPDYRYLLPTACHPWGRTQHFSLCPSLCPQLLLP